jgi:hypothetical protein
MLSPEDILKKLGKKNEKLELGEGEDKLVITIEGLTFKEIAHLAPHLDRNNTDYALNYMCKVTLKKSFPQWSDNQIEAFIENVNPKYLIEIIRAVRNISMPNVEKDNQEKNQ